MSYHTLSYINHIPNIYRMEVCDLQARPIFAFPPTASTSPACTDESILDFFFNLDMLFQVQGSLFSLATLF